MRHVRHLAYRTLRVVACGVFVAAFASGGSAQEAAEQPGDALTEGLLDLLDKPPATPVDRAAPGIERPADVGLDGEDLGEQAENPLAAVRQSMLIAAGYLQRGRIDDPTQQLQSDIVTRLDEIIEQVEQQQQQRQREQQRSQQPRESPQTSPPQDPSSETAQSPETSQSRADESDPGEPTGEENLQQREQQAGQDSAGGDQRVQLADPQALQRSVWGQLPEQVRKRMQSRMVEQFLPSYREQIEAYFQALLEAQ